MAAYQPALYRSRLRCCDCPQPLPSNQHIKTSSQQRLQPSTPFASGRYMQKQMLVGPIPSQLLAVRMKPCAVLEVESCTLSARPRALGRKKSMDEAAGTRGRAELPRSWSHRPALAAPSSLRSCSPTGAVLKESRAPAARRIWNVGSFPTIALSAEINT